MKNISQAKFNRYQKRIDAGIRWLNRAMPDWHQLIDLDRLKMDDASTCMVGQTFENFWNKFLGPDGDSVGIALSPRMSFDKAIQLGFAEQTRGQNYDFLTLMWAWNVTRIRLEHKLIP
jgi:hypothetical protein